MECVRLRVKDVDFDYHQIVVRDGKGAKDRVTMLPRILEDPLHQQIAKVKTLHEQDLAERFGEVYMPYALAEKYPNMAKSFCWQFVFTSHKLSKDPRSDRIMRHHIQPQMLQRAVGKAIVMAGVQKPGGCLSVMAVVGTWGWVLLSYSPPEGSVPGKTHSTCCLWTL